MTLPLGELQCKLLLPSYMTRIQHIARISTVASVRFELSSGIKRGLFVFLRE